MSNEISKCPFCGNDKQHIGSNGVGSFWVCCEDGCGCEGPYRQSEAEAIEAWNTRALTPTAALAVVGAAWKKVPAEATKELLADASSKQAGDTQVLCYENGAYYNAWLIFEEYEGGWIWMNEADSEPNPSHYMALPAGPQVAP